MKMFNAATAITAAAVSSGKIPADAEEIADFYFKVLQALETKYQEAKDAVTSKTSSRVRVLG